MKNIFSAHDEKMTDKSFSRMMVVSIVGIFLTLVSLCSVTWAWFKTDISLSNNTLRTATSNLELTVTSGGTPVTPTDTNPEGRPVYVFEKDTPYTVTLQLGDADTAHAYCAVVVDDFPYYSKLLYASSNVHVLYFTLQFSSTQSGIEILPCWGIPNAELLFENGHVYLDLAEADPSLVNTPATDTTGSTEETTEPENSVDSPEESTEAESPVETPEESTEAESPVETPEETTEPESPVETPEETTEPESPVETPEETTEPESPVESPEETTAPESPVETPEETNEIENTTESPTETPEETAEPESPVAPPEESTEAESPAEITPEETNEAESPVV